MNGVRFLCVALVAASLISCAPRAADAQVGRKSGRTAFLLSFLGTTVPIGGAVLFTEKGGGDNSVEAYVAAAGYLLGPSLGHYYADRPRRARLGIGLRVVTGAIGASLLVRTIDFDTTTHEDPAPGYFFLGLSGATVLYDIATAPGSARAYNRKIGDCCFRITPANVAGAPGVRLSWAM